MEGEKRLIDPNEAMIYAQKVFSDTVLLYAIKNVLDNSTTVDAVKVVYGRWIDRPAVKGQVYCSECATIEKSTDSNYRSRHCPKCGAKMDGDGYE